jgi:DNA-directed RNA polymerase subunit M/transcription elongation factor TFIIS
MVSTYVLYNLQEEIDKYKNDSVSDYVSVDCCKNNVNNKHIVREEFKKLLIDKLKIPELEATDLEIGVFNATIDYANSSKIQLSWKCQMLIDIYINIARSVYSNLNNESYIGNKNLMERLLKKREFLPHMLPYMLCQDIFPERWKYIVEKNKLRFKAAYDVKQVAMSDMIQCSRCKGKKVSYYELQTRSGDEATTLFMNCLICGKKWKQ